MGICRRDIHSTRSRHSPEALRIPCRRYGFWVLRTTAHNWRHILGCRSASRTSLATRASTGREWPSCTGQMFKPSAYLSEPKVNVGLQVICAPTEEEAKFIGASRSLNKVISALGLTTGGLLPPEDAINWPLDESAKHYMKQSTQSYIEGDPEQVREGILVSAERYETTDVGIVTNCYYFEHRKRSYELVAEVMGVAPMAAVQAD